MEEPDLLVTGARPAVGGQLGAGAWRSLARVWASKDGGGRDP